MFDGDTVSCSGILSEEANAEIAQYLQSPKSVIGVNGSLKVGLSTDLCRLTVYNLTRDPIKSKG